MNCIIRDINSETDFAQLVPILSEAWGEPISVTQLQEWDADRPEGQVRRRAVMVTDAGEIVGYSDADHEPWMQDGRFIILVIIATQYRQQGFGSQLYDNTLQWVQAQGATWLDTEAREDCDAGLAFAEKRGFTKHHRLFESRIDLPTFDDIAYEGLIKSLQAKGFRFFSLAEAGDTLEMRRKLYEVNKTCSFDDPSSSGYFIDFENFNNMFNTASWFRPEGQILASVQTDEGKEKVVGLSAVGYFDHTNSMYNMFTGVDRAYRGQKLAQALKLLSVRFAKAYGADYILTHNDSQNAPMLAINRKLGYVRQVGVYRMVKKL